MVAGVGGVPVIAVILLLVSGCGAPAGSTGAGASGTSASPASSGASAAPRPIVSPGRLNAGSYPTAPRAPLGVAGNPELGAVADARQLADFVIGPWDVDDALTGVFLNTYYVIGSAQGLQQLGPEQIAQAAGEHGMINGFASARQTIDKAGPDARAMLNGVLRFPDPAAATTAAAAMGAAAVGQPVKGIMPTALPIPDHPEAVASTYPFTPHGSDQPRATVRAFTPYGPYVLMHFVQAVAGPDRAAGLIASAIEKQKPVLDEFQPAADLAAVPLDPTGLLARTLPASGAPTAKNAVYATRGAEHFQTNPVASSKLFGDTGTTAVAMGSANVYQTKDEASAAIITDSFSQEIASQGSPVAETVTALPDSHCYAIPQAFYCVAPAGRNAIEVRGTQLTDVHQQLSAQYILLTAP